MRSAWPFPPIRVTFGPMSRGPASRARRLPRRLPPSRRGGPPRAWPGCRDRSVEHSAPVSNTRGELAASRRRDRAHVGVDRPGRRPARIPSGPSSTASTALVSVSIEKTTSEAAATSRGVQPTPSAPDQRLRLRLGRFQPVTSCPASSSRSTIPEPMAPGRGPTFTGATLRPPGAGGAKTLLTRKSDVGYSVV